MVYFPAPGDHNKTANPVDQTSPIYRRHLLSIVVGVLAAAFLLAPWPFEVKAHAVLHGICGQTPSHTMTFAGKELPLDSRCVGIFSGLLITFLLLLGVGRSRAAALPSVGAGILLIGFLGAMAFDGLNSLMTDLDRWHLYTPTNELRLLTGWMAGVGLGTLLIMVTGMTLWQRPNVSMKVLPDWRWPIAMLLPCIPAWLLLKTGSRFVYYPMSILLIAAAITAFATLAVCAIVMLRNRDNSISRFDEVVPLVAVGLIIAVTILLSLSGGRFWLEQTFQLAPPA